MLPLWQQFVAANAEAHTAGLPLPYTTAYPFYQWFIWIGGAGATLPPTLLLLMSGHGHLRRIGRISLVPALFNVNEPFLFGLPVVANPLLAIPCVLAPLACGTVAWFGVAGGWVTAPFIEVPWVMPCFLGALLSTQDLRALLLLAFNFGLSAAIWWPFLKAYERRLKQSGESPSPPRT
jgi:PTS system cellobiose-specific IIC component